MLAKIYETAASLFRAELLSFYGWANLTGVGYISFRFNRLLKDLHNVDLNELDGINRPGRYDEIRRITYLRHSLSSLFVIIMFLICVFGVANQLTPSTNPPPNIFNASAG